jgi:hypothetical protein
MNFRKHAALPLIALAMTLPVMAQANSLYHPASGRESASPSTLTTGRAPRRVPR